MDRWEVIRIFAGTAADSWTEEQLEQGEEHVRKYVEIAVRIFERLELEEKDRSLTLRKDGVG